MANLPVIRAVSMRPSLGSNDAVGLEIVSEKGDHFVVALSCEVKALIDDIQVFLDEHPHLASQKSRPQQ